MSPQQKQTSLRWTVGILVVIFMAALGVVWGVNTAAANKLDEEKLEKAVFVEHKEAQQQQVDALQNSIDKSDSYNREEFNKLGDKMDKVLEKL